MSATDRFGARFRKAEVLYLARMNKIFHGTGRLLDGGVGIDAVLIEKVDLIGLQALKGTFDDLLDVFGAAVGRCPLAIVARIGLKAKLSRDDYLFPERRESFTDDFFVHVGTVHLSSVEEGDAALHGGSDELDGFRLLRCGA